MTLKWYVTAGQNGLILRDFLLQEKGVSRRSLTAIKYSGGKIYVNGLEKTVRHLLQQGDIVVVEFPLEKRGNGLEPFDFPLKILYEDDYILVVDKPPNMATIPSREHASKTLANAVIHYYDDLQLPYTAHFVNRLDYGTSGLLIIAKHNLAHHQFSLEQQKGNIKRNYKAIVHGNVVKDYDSIDAPIGRKPSSIIEREVREDGKHAVTHFHVVERFGDRTLVSLILQTGRTHQIRVHMSYIGHPLLGDELYKGKTDLIKRQALHSEQLTFYHPFLEKELHFTNELPDDMLAILK